MSDPYIYIGRSVRAKWLDRNGHHSPGPKHRLMRVVLSGLALAQKQYKGEEQMNLNNNEPQNPRAKMNEWNVVHEEKEKGLKPLLPLALLQNLWSLAKRRFSHLFAHFSTVDLYHHHVSTWTWVKVRPPCVVNRHIKCCYLPGFIVFSGGCRGW